MWPWFKINELNYNRGEEHNWAGPLAQTPVVLPAVTGDFGERIDTHSKHFVKLLVIDLLIAQISREPSKRKKSFPFSFI